MRLSGQQSIYIYIPLFISLIGGCGGKNIEHEIDRLGTRIASLDQRLKVIEEWTEAQTNLPTQLVRSNPVEEVDTFAELEEKLRQVQLRLHQIENRLANTHRTQKQVEDLAAHLATLETQIGYLRAKDTEQTARVKVAPPAWLQKVIWEADGVIYAVGSSTNKRSGQEFALLNAKNALLEYLGVQVVSEVQVVETYRDNRKTYVLVSKIKPIDPD
ncbi:MAG: hypothetical protein O7E52_02880 [Candidatus Poribacteria bacterium]|nr:hypothetical protein [Candidatus Poribacteria bacterium]